MLSGEVLSLPVLNGRGMTPIFDDEVFYAVSAERQERSTRSVLVFCLQYPGQVNISSRVTMATPQMVKSLGRFSFACGIGSRRSSQFSRLSSFLLYSII